jgi:hypothetical protein
MYEAWTIPGAAFLKINVTGFSSLPEHPRGACPQEYTGLFTVVLSIIGTLCWTESIVWGISDTNDVS